MTVLSGLAAMQPWLMWLIIILAAVIVFGVIMHFINRSFRIKYDLNLFGGGLLMAIALASAVGGYFLVKGEAKIGYALFALTAILIIVTLIYDVKKCGGMGVVALICQILFSVGSILLIFDFFGNKSRSSVSHSIREDRIVRRERERRGYNDRDRGYY